MQIAPQARVITVVGSRGGAKGPEDGSGGRDRAERGLSRCFAARRWLRAALAATLLIAPGESWKMKSAQANVLRGSSNRHGDGRGFFENYAAAAENKRTIGNRCFRFSRPQVDLFQENYRC
jgi:hypothetical protein